MVAGSQRDDLGIAVATPTRPDADTDQVDQFGSTVAGRYQETADADALLQGKVLAPVRFAARMQSATYPRRQRGTGFSVREREQHRRQRASHFVLIELAC